MLHRIHASTCNALLPFTCFSDSISCSVKHSLTWQIEIEIDIADQDQELQPSLDNEIQIEIEIVAPDCQLQIGLPALSC